MKRIVLFLVLVLLISTSVYGQGIKGLRPSYKQGYAKSTSEAISSVSSLRRNLIGLWMPALGHTGLALRDVAERKNHGTLTNMVLGTDLVRDADGYGLLFNGTGDKHVLIPNQSSMALMNEATIVAWVKTSTTDIHDVVFSGFTSGGANDGVMLAVGDATAPNQGKVAMFDGDQFVISTNVVDDGALHMISGTIDSSGNTSVYIGGIQDNTAVTTPSLNTTADHLIGDRIDFLASGEFDGTIYVVMFWSRALSSKEMKLLNSDMLLLVRQRERVLAPPPLPATSRSQVIIITQLMQKLMGGFTFLYN